MASPEVISAVYTMHLICWHHGLLAHRQSGKSMDVYGQSVLDGAGIQLYDYLGNNNQKWVITPVSGGYYSITGVQSGKVIEVPAQSTAPGATIAQYTNNGGNHQQWSFQ
jgi:hypothetical protein